MKQTTTIAIIFCACSSAYSQQPPVSPSRSLSPGQAPAIDRSVNGDEGLSKQKDALTKLLTAQTKAIKTLTERVKSLEDRMEKVEGKNH
jgi:hypothetical protein